MSKRFFVLSLGLSLVACLSHGLARAEDMDLQLSRLSISTDAPGDGQTVDEANEAACRGTLLGSDKFSLTNQAGTQILNTDDAAWASLVTQLAPVMMPAVLAPVTTSGPRGVDVSLQTSITGIDKGADYWKRGTKGHGPDAVATCDGRNRFVNPFLVHNRLVFNKGLPLGLTIGAEIGRVWKTSLWTIGGTVKLALVEGYRTLGVPDLAVRASGSTVVGDPQFSMTTVTAEGLLSKNLVVGQVAQFSPFLGGGVAWTFASSELVDLTPNIDAVACSVGRGQCDGENGRPTQTSVDISHDLPFKELRLMRYRGFAGMMFRYRAFSIAAEVMMDLLAPNKADKEAGAGTPKQWTISVAPALTY